MKICCCCSCLGFIAALALLFLYLASAPWTMVNLECDWEARTHFGVALTGSGLFVVAGTDGVRNFADVWRSPDLGQSWQLLVETAPFGARHGHGMVYKGNDIFLFGGDAGGVSESPSLEPLSDVWRSDDGEVWLLVNAAAPWPPRMMMGATVDTQGALFVVGGRDGYGFGGLNDMWRSDDEGITWHALARTSLWSGRYSFGFVHLLGGINKDRLYLLGGQDGRAQHDVWTSDTQGEGWSLMVFTHVSEATSVSQEPFASWSPRYDMAVVVDRDGLLTLLGGLGDGAEADRFSNEVWQLDSPDPDDTPFWERSNEPKIDALQRPLGWKKQSNPPWTPRFGHRAFVDDEGVPYILGGEDQMGLKRDMWKMQSSISIANMQDAYARTSSQAMSAAGGGSNDGDDGSGAGAQPADGDGAGTTTDGPSARQPSDSSANQPAASWKLWSSLLLLSHATARLHSVSSMPPRQH